MNLKVVYPLAVLALCFMVTGCFTENYEKSQGSIVNLRNGKPTVTVQMLANGDGHLKNGSAFKLFSFYYESHYELVDKSEPKGWGTDDAYLLAIFYPTNVPYHALKAEAGSHQVYAWFLPNDFPDRGQLFTYLNLPNDASLTPRPNNGFFNFFNLPYPAPHMVGVGDWWYRFQMVNADLTNEISAAESPTSLSIPGSMPLHGTVTIKPGSWYHKNFFHADIDLTGIDSLKLEGEYTSYDYRRFEPEALLAYLFWHGG